MMSLIVINDFHCIQNISWLLAPEIAQKSVKYEAAFIVLEVSDLQFRGFSYTLLYNICLHLS
jgi:hypothetical protein